MKRIRVVLIWVVGIFFIVVGVLKYLNLDTMTKPVFERADFPKWFPYAVGGVEFIGGLLMLITATNSQRLGSALIGVIMVGAIGTRLMLHEHFSHFVVPGAVLLFAILTVLRPVGKEK